MTVACTEDVEPVLPIDKFIGNFEGNLKKYSCEENQALLNTFENIKSEIKKESDTSINGTLNDADGNKMFDFSGELDESDDTKIRISNLVYDSETLFGGGEIIGGKLRLQFASFSCKLDSNVYRVTRVFTQQ